MEITSSSKTTTDLQVPRKWKENHHHHQQQQQQMSPERTKVWTEPNNKNNKTTTAAANKTVPVIYYLTRNGQLQHPHFTDVPLSSPEGLYLKDVINHLNLLRGKGMASMYSWSSKWSYKNGFVWHDLSETDFIHPAHGQEYILKGSEIIDASSLVVKPLETAASSSFRMKKSGNESADFPVITRRRNQSWSSFELNEYKVYKSEPNSESFRQLASDASTQTTDDRRRRRKPVKVDVEEEKGAKSQSQSQETNENQTTELSRGEISPPPSDSSPETLESLMNVDGRLIPSSSSDNSKNEGISNRTVVNYQRGRTKASTVLMQLISCGSIAFKGCGPGHGKDQGLSFLGHFKSRLPRGVVVKKELAVAEVEIRNFERVKLEDKKLF